MKNTNTEVKISTSELGQDLDDYLLKASQGSGRVIGKTQEG